MESLAACHFLRNCENDEEDDDHDNHDDIADFDNYDDDYLPFFPGRTLTSWIGLETIASSS